MKTYFPPDWKNWIATNVNAGQDLDGIFKILLDEGFQYQAIVNELNYQPSQPIEKLVNPLIATINNNGAGVSKTQIIIPQAKHVSPDSHSNDIDLRIVKNFLTPQECQKVIKLIKTELRPSEVASNAVNSGYRNSQTCDLGRLNNKFIEAIDLRICQLMGIHRAYSELLEGQYYQVGQEFKAHTDYFDKAEFNANCHEFGQRTFTVMVYLNDVEKGGETHFVNINKAFTPTAGTAVIWNNLNPDGTPNNNTLHQSNPVEQGNKAIITKWFRSKPANGYEYLPMLTQNVNSFG